MAAFGQAAPPDWFDGSSVDEIAFSEYVLYKHPMRCIHDRLYDIDGLLSDAAVQSEILEYVRPYVKSNVAKNVEKYLNALKLAAYCPELPIQEDRIHFQNGTYFIEEIKYPLKSLEKGDWIIRDMIGEEYKHGEGQDGSFTKNVKMRYKVILPEKIYLKDIKEVSVGLYNQETRKWQLDAQEVVFRDEEHEKKNKEKYTRKVVEFTCSELGIFSVLLERKINFPYKSWNLRCIKNPENNQLLAILNLETPRTKFVFELGIDDPDLNFESNVKHDPVKAYVKLIDNEEEEFNHIADKKLTFDEMILAMKECGILLAPWKEDIEASGIKEKNQETINRAVDDIVMACRYYSIKSHELNKLINQDLIAVKAKPNPEFDKYFFDDEEKDWTDFCWYPNKASIGRFEIKTEGEESTIEFVSSIETTRPHLHLVIKDTQPEEVYEQISEDETSSAFLVNIRNMVRVLSLVNIP